jgi:hypothetical protein
MGLFRRRRPAASPVILYVSENCGLCDRAERILDELDIPYELVSVPDEHAYRLRTPVLEILGHVVAEGEIDERVLRRAVGRRRG